MFVYALKRLLISCYLLYYHTLRMTVLLSFTNTLLYFAWEDQSVAASCIFHIVSISCITVLYESYSTVMQLIGQIQCSYAANWANTV